MGLLRKLFSTLVATFANNTLSKVITTATIVAVGLGYFYAKDKYEQWVKERTLEKKIEAVIDRCVRDELTADRIEEQAREAITNDPNNDFINQRVRDN